MPGRGRGAGHRGPPRGPGGHGDRKVAGLSGAGRPERARRSWWPPRPRRCRTSWPTKDLPLVEAGLGLPVPLDFAVLKGRSNYLCRQRVAEVGSGGVQAELGDRRPAARTPRPVDAGGGGERGRRRRCDAARGPGRPGATAGGLVPDVGDRGPGRPRLRAVRPGLEHGQRRAARVPRRLQLPVGRPVLRRGGPRPGRRGGHRRGQHPPLRRPPGQRAASCCPSTTSWSSTRPTSSRRS